MNIFVGNLNIGANEAQLRNLFKKFGKVNSVNIIMDMEMNQSKGFGFVEMDERGDGVIAIRNLNNHDFMGQLLEVQEAIKKPAKENKFVQNAAEQKSAQKNIRKK